MKRILIAALLGASAAPALADDVSKNAGICAAYKVAAKQSDADAALNAATNRQLAINHGKDWMRRLSLVSKDANGQRGLVSEAVTACNRVGLRGT